MSVVLRLRNSGLPSLADFYPLLGHLNFAMPLGSVINSLLSPYRPTSQVISFNVIALNIIYRQKTPKFISQSWTSTVESIYLTTHSTDLIYRYFSGLCKWTCHKWTPDFFFSETLPPCSFLFWWITISSFNLLKPKLLEAPLILFLTLYLGSFSKSCLLYFWNISTIQTLLTMPASLTLVQPQSFCTCNIAVVSSSEIFSEVFSNSSNISPSY